MRRHFALEERQEGVLRHSRLDPDSVSRHPEAAHRLGCFRNGGRKLETIVSGSVVRNLVHGHEEWTKRKWTGRKDRTYQVEVVHSHS